MDWFLYDNCLRHERVTQGRRIALVTESVALYITSGGQDIIRSFILHTNIKNLG